MYWVFGVWVVRRNNNLHRSGGVDPTYLTLASLNMVLAGVARHREAR